MAEQRRRTWRLGVLVAALSVMAMVASGGVSQAAASRHSAHLIAGSDLHVTSSTAIPHANGHDRLVAAEASDDHVFVAVPRTASTDEIEVAIGADPLGSAETVPAGTVALATSDSELFVAGRHAISSFDRQTGAPIRTWQVKVSRALAAFGGAFGYGDGRLWALGSMGHGRKVIKINPQSATAKVIGSGHNVANLAAGPRGVYYVHSGGHKLVRVAGDGARLTAPTHEVVNEKLSGPGAVQTIAIDANTVLVSHDAGQGLDSELVRYNAKTLARRAAVATDVFHTAVVPSSDGDLVMFNGTTGEGCSTSASPVCVAVISAKTAKTSHDVVLPTTQALSLLLGPSPAVVVRHSGHARLIRLH